MQEFLIKILKSVVQSILVSILLLIISYSFMTGQFPPNFAKIKSSFADFKKMQSLAQQALQQHSALSASLNVPTGPNNEQRTQIPPDMLVLHGTKEELAELEAIGATEGMRNPANSAVASRNDQLEQKIRNLQNELFRLQQRVSELESKSSAK